VPIAPKPCWCSNPTASTTRGPALATLPLVSQGLIDFDLIPLRPYPGFARLFK
jgi:hypothetical protein